jgi:PAS domain S-box-containing protein
MTPGERETVKTEEAQKRTAVSAISGEFALRRAYLSSYVLLVLFSFGLYVISYTSWEKSSSRGSYIDLAGRQRMVSQRIVVLADEILFDHQSPTRAEEELEQELRKLLHEFQETHHLLSRGDSDHSIYPIRTPEIRSLLTKMDLPRTELIASTESLIDANSLKSKESAFRTLRASSNAFLPLMEALVHQYTKETEKEMNHRHNMMRSFLLLQFLILTALAFLVFEPLTRRFKKNRETSESTMQELMGMTHRLELALTVTNTGLWDWDVDEETTYFSDSWYTMLGYEPGELPMTFETWQELTHPSDLELATQKLEDAIAGKCDTYSCKIRMKRKDGSWLWIDDIGKVVEWHSDNTPKRMVGVHLSLEEITQHLDIMQGVLNQTAAISETDKFGRITYVNEYFCSLSQYSREELLGHTHKKINSKFP